MRVPKLPQEAQPDDSSESFAVNDLTEQPKTASPIGAWLARARNPIVLRVPRGLVVILGIATLALIFLTYWVGYQAAAEARGVSSSTSIDAQHQNLSGDVPRANKRVNGLSYLVLVDWLTDQYGFSDMHQEALRLMAFLRKHDVEASIYSNNNNVLKVVDLNGFAEDELGTKEYVTYRRRLNNLGRRWKAVDGGAADFSSMYLDKYDK